MLAVCISSSGWVDVRMTREIKFRAWDKKQKCYFTNLQRQYFFKKVIELFNKATGRFVVEQYTGLKDKNGKEIYDGDIVKCGFVYEVAWLEKDGGWFCFRDNDTVYTPLYHLKCEVIGNIHENPELLGVEE